jgi:ubiquinone/menaquinone biosynthesis C-methylase UbiE
MDKSFDQIKKPALDARYDAQKIAFAPVVFQAVKILRDRDILSKIEESGDTGKTIEELSQDTGISAYGVRVLLETGLSAGVVHMKDERYLLTRTGYFIINDEMTRVNMDFIQDVCYLPLFHLEESIEKGSPRGLKVFGNWKTVYEGLAELPEEVKKSWFAFDHFYSDSAFPKALPHVFRNGPKTLLDIGGNTGRFALRCLAHDPEVKVTIADLPGQLAVAFKNAEDAGVSNHLQGTAVDLLEESSELPSGFDAVWMSQFLVCFSPEEIHNILVKVREAMDENTELYILDTFWDRQAWDIAAYCLINSSPYFTAVANGNSMMYRSEDFYAFLEKAGLQVTEEWDGLGISHTLLCCGKVGK